MKKAGIYLLGIVIILNACSPTSHPIVGAGNDVDPYHFTSTKTIMVKKWLRCKCTSVGK
jgi:hypothetical protein